MDEYVFDELASGSEDEKQLKKAALRTQQTVNEVRVTVYLRVGNFLQIWIFGSK